MEDKIYLVEGRQVISIGEEGGRITNYARLLMEEHLGRPLDRSEVVHHIDKDPLNNEISNLKVMTRGEHNILHNTGKVFSSERRKNIGEGRQGILHSQETKDEMSRTRREVPKTEETKERMHQAALDRWKIQNRTWDLSDVDLDTLRIGGLNGMV